MAYKQQINSRDKNTPGTFREDQEKKYPSSLTEDNYKKTRKLPNTKDIYEFVSESGKTTLAQKQDGRYRILYKDQEGKEVYKQ